MDNTQNESAVANLMMATEDHYRQKAACYKSSAEYKKMLRLYPVLQKSIGTCSDEKLVA